jgi:hypothetical protein
LGHDDVLERTAANREIHLRDFLVDILRLVFNSVEILHSAFDGLERGSFTREAPMVDGKVWLFKCSRAKGLASSWVSGMRSSSPSPGLVSLTEYFPGSYLPA